jgi:hypothetical protein
MVKIALEKNANRRVRSFNLDQRHYDEIKRVAGIEGLSMSDILNRLCAHGLAKKKVAEDVAAGLQTTLDIHIHDQRHRDGRKDGKCNPKSEGGHCVVCWGEMS